MTEYQLTKEDIAALRRLRDAGCAVCVFLPHEMGDTDTELVEDAMVIAGWGRIQYETAKEKAE